MQIFKIDYKQSTTSSKDRTVLICSLTEKKVHHHRHNLDLPRSMFKSLFFIVVRSNSNSQLVSQPLTLLLNAHSHILCTHDSYFFAY